MTIRKTIGQAFVRAMFATACVCSVVAQAQAAEGEQPANLPPEGSPPLMRNVELKFDSEDGGSSVNYDTYLYYMEIAKHISAPSQENWVPYTEETERILRGDFYRLWETKFLDDLKIEVVDEPYPNGVIGKRAIFTLAERPRIRIVTFEGSTEVKRTDIDTAMQDMDLEIRLDSFLDLQKVKQVEGLVASMFSANGYQFAEISHDVTPIEAVANAVRLTFHMAEGPKVHVQTIDFVGNERIDDGTLKSQMEQTKERWWLSWITGRGTYKAALFEQDADLIVEHYLNHGYIDANVGSPDTEYLDEAGDLQAVESLSQLSELAESDERYAELAVSAARDLGMPRREHLSVFRTVWAIRWLKKEATETENGTEEDVVDGVNALARSERDNTLRLMRLRIPVDEGERYRVGEVRFDGHNVMSGSGIEAVFAGLRSGEYYSQAAVTQGLEAARELYGSIGYTDLTIFPDLQRRNAPVGDEELDPEVDGEVEAAGIGDEDPGQYADLERPTHMDGAPIVDVTIRIEEGEQQYVNRITFAGHESTQDEVIRRELQLVENGVFSTSALKNSVLRLNQLGYFEPFEEDAVDIEAVEGRDNAVDLTVNLSEANLNQLTFGAGASQFDGFFGQVSFMTTNFLGRGETLQVSIQNGSRFRDINLGYTKPYLFGRNMSGGVNLFNRRINWIGAFTQKSSGGGVTIGKPLALFTRFFVSYSIERTGVSDVDPFILGSDGGRDNPFLSPFLADALLLGTDGRRTVSKVTPSLRFNTVDHPIFPTRGRSYTAAIELAGVGGNTRFLKPTLEGIWYLRHTSRTLFGFRGQYQHIFAGRPETIPVFERLWLGGEYSLRGFDLRRVGPTIADVEPEVDAESFQGRTLIGGNKSVLLNAEYQFSIAQPVRLVFFYDVGQVQNFGSAFTKDDFKTSTGVEFRFFMPMLNIPFRLIYAWNPQRDGVYNDRLAEQEASGFRFAVGTTF